MFEVFLCIVACALLENCVFLLQPFWLKFFSAAALKKAALKKAALSKASLLRNGWSGWTIPLPKALCKDPGILFKVLQNNQTLVQDLGGYERIF